MKTSLFDTLGISLPPDEKRMMNQVGIEKSATGKKPSTYFDSLYKKKKIIIIIPTLTCQDRRNNQ